MIELTAREAPLTVALPWEAPGLTLRALAALRITALAPWPGQTEALRDHLGAFPAPGEVVGIGDWRLVWAGRDLAFAFDADLPEGLEALCAVTDLSDGWCGLDLSGPNAVAHLARRLPLDVRRLPVPGSARSILGHIPVLVIRTGREHFELWTWRSMVQSLVEDLRSHAPPTGVAGRQGAL